MLCDHCLIEISGTPVIREVEEKKRSFCCSSCADIFTIIFKEGFAEYYRKRTSAEGTFEPLLYELDESAFSQYVKTDRYHSIKLLVQGIHCRSCIWLLSKMLEKTAGVVRFSFSPMINALQLEWDNDKITLPELLKIFYQLGYPVLPYTRSSYQAALKSELRDSLIRFGTAAFLSMNQMVFSFALYIGYFQDIGQGNTQMFSWLGAALTTPVLFGCGAPIFSRAWRNVIRGTISMDILISLGAACAYLVSIYGTLTGGEVYYDTASMIITLVLLGRVIEVQARNQGADTIARYLTYQSRKAVRLLENGQKETILPEQIRCDDLIEVKTGESIPADGFIIEGKAEINQSHLTGEPLPVLKKEGGNVLGGTLVEEGYLVFRATEVGERSFLNRLIRITEQAQNNRTAIQRLADRITSYFVPAVTTLAFFTFIFQINQGNKIIASLFGAISVILIACPCALGLATPLTISLAIGVAAKRGILIKESHVLERLNSIKAVFIDKTGTLTRGIPQVVKAIFKDPRVIPYLINLERRSSHPIARAIAAINDAQEMPVRSYRNHTGKGVMAMVAGKNVAVGTPCFLQENGFEDSDRLLSDSGTRTTVFVGWDTKVVGMIQLEDLIRPESRKLIAWLTNRGIKVRMLTGDNENTAGKIAQEVGIQEVYSRCLPEEKLDHIRSLQESNTPVMMIGDGSNDAPALSLADIGIAMGKGADLALENAPVTLLSASLDDIPWLFGLAGKTMRIVKQNLFWAFVYNLVGIPLAMTGLLSPIHAASMMVLSSLCVAVNSLRIKRYPGLTLNNRQSLKNKATELPGNVALAAVLET